MSRRDPEPKIPAINEAKFDKTMLLYIIEDIQKDLEYYVAKLDLVRKRVEVMKI